MYNDPFHLPPRPQKRLIMLRTRTPRPPLINLSFLFFHLYPTKYRFANTAVEFVRERNIRSFSHFDGSRRTVRFFTAKREIAGGERRQRTRSHKGVRVRVGNATGPGVLPSLRATRSHENSIGSAAMVAASWNFPKFLMVIVTRL